MVKFFWLRFKPFLFCFVGFQVLSLCGKFVQSWEGVSLSPLNMAATLGGLALTSVIAFLYMMLPYLFYLLFLPARKVNSKLDKVLLSFKFVSKNLIYFENKLFKNFITKSNKFELKISLKN